MTTEGNPQEDTIEEVVEEVTDIKVGDAEEETSSRVTQNLADLHFPVAGNSDAAKKQRAEDIANFIVWLQGILDDDLARNMYGNRHYYDGAVGEIAKTKQELINIQADIE